MKKQFCWNILAIILLCICLPFGLCDKNGQQQHRSAVDRASLGGGGGGGGGSVAGRSGKFRPPIRDENDYIHRDEDPADTINDEYDDEYSDDDMDGVGSNGGVNEARNEAYDDDDDENESPEIVEQAQSARTQIIQRPKELTEAELNALLLKSLPTPSSGVVDTSVVVDSADATAPSSIETCPKECSCLNDFMTCTRPHLKHLPKVPHFIQSLYVFFPPSLSFSLHIIFLFSL